MFKTNGRDLTDTTNDEKYFNHGNLSSVSFVISMVKILWRLELKPKF